MMVPEAIRESIKNVIHRNYSVTVISAQRSNRQQQRFGGT